MYVPDDKVLGNPGLFGLVGGAVAAVSGAVTKARVESHIQDRVAKYQNMPDEQLRQILAVGGEAGEAAKRVLAQRGGGVSVAPPPPPLIDLSKIVKLPEVPTVARIEAPPMPNWVVPVALLGGGILLATTLAKRGR